MRRVAGANAIALAIRKVRICNVEKCVHRYVNTDALMRP